MFKHIHPSQIVSQTLVMPPSKSHSIRALLFAALAEGESILSDLLPSPDIDAMVIACRALGATVRKEKQAYHVKGVAGHIYACSSHIDAGNSGQVARFITALLACSATPVTMDGDASIRHNRPMKPLLEALQQKGAHITTHGLPYHAPFTIKGPIEAGHFYIEGNDSQPVSALLIQ